ncbi:hypothetical protein [Pseudomonas sp. NPDC012596]|uniref:hypothetical protein n=1 Tax=Pseudomonas sp. NPDC012596 TaxID=3364419 RepID=UPI00368E2BD5
MAGLWEPVGGVFWSTPPVVPDEGWVYGPPTVALLVAAVVTGVVLGRMVRKYRGQEDWHVRQHITEIGGALTLIYLVSIGELTWGRIDTLGSMPLNEVGDFLAGAFGPVAFLWLVLGFLQQGEELRMSTKALKDQADELKKTVEHQATMASVATKQIKAQEAALELQMQEAERVGRANFTFGNTGARNGATFAGTWSGMTLRISPSSAPAYDVKATFVPPIGDSSTVTFDAINVDSNGHIQLRYINQAEDVSGVLTVSYKSNDGLQRQERFVYTISSTDRWVRVIKRLSDRE